jgi:type VI secretion system secreted protein Hcp
MKSAIILLAVLGLALIAGMAPSAAAATDMFIKIGDIKGESQDSVHKDEIDVLAWSWGMSNTGSASSGGAGGAGKATVQDFSFTKFVDLSTTDLMLNTLTGKHIPEAKFVVRKAGVEPLEFLKITFTDVLVTSVSTGGSGGEDRLTENITLNFAKVKVEYTKQDPDGKPGATKSFTWDIAGNKEA